MQGLRKPVAWFAALAMVLQALWPLLAHARPAEAPILVQLCTIDSVTHYIELKTGKQTPLEQRSASHGEHCKLCVFEGAKDVLAVFEGIVSFSREKEEALETEKPFRLASFPATPAQPRAPPTLS